MVDGQMAINLLLLQHLPWCPEGTGDYDWRIKGNGYHIRSLFYFFPVEGNSLKRQKAAFQGWRLKQQREPVSRKPASLLAQK
jgi:hypothetical protein